MSETSTPPSTTLDSTYKSPEVTSNCPSLAAGVVASLVVVAVVTLLLFLLCLYMFLADRRTKQSVVEHGTSQQDRRHTSGLSVDSHSFRDTLRGNTSAPISLPNSPSLEVMTESSSRRSCGGDVTQVPTMVGFCSTPARLEQLQEINEGFSSTKSLNSMDLDISSILSQEEEQGSLMGSIFEELGNETASAVPSSFRCIPFSPRPLSMYTSVPSLAGHKSFLPVKTSTLPMQPIKSLTQLYHKSPGGHEASSSIGDSPCVLKGV